MPDDATGLSAGLLQLDDLTSDKNHVRNLIFGTIGVVIGLAFLLASLTGGSAHHGTGAYGAGQSAGEVARVPLAVLFLLAGLWALRKGMRSRGR